MLNCAGCFNQETHTFNKGNFWFPDALASRLLQIGAEGVTFSGGEPLHQAAALANVMYLLKLSNPKLSIGMFTGYSFREATRGEYFHPFSIRKHDRGNWKREANILWWESIRDHLDFAVMGRYNQNKPSSLPLRSSANQELQLFSGRYQDTDFAPQQVEFNITSDLIQITGYPTREVHANL